MESFQRKLPPNPRESANLFSRHSFWWTIDIFRKGLKQSLDTSDLFSANKNDSSMLLGNNLQRCWDKKTSDGKPSLLKVICLAFKSELLLLGLLQLSTHVTRSLGIPYFIGEFLQYYRLNSDIEYASAVRSAIGLITSLGYVVIVGNNFQATAQHVGMRIRIAVCSLIYRKTLRLSWTALSDANPGKVINLISNDVTRFEYVTMSMNTIWIGAFNSIFIIYFLWSKARWASLVGIIFLVLIAPLQTFFGKLAARYRYRISIKTDERVRLMEEIISGCKVIKMYAWEKPFGKLIQTVRRLELKSVRKSSFMRANFLGLMFSNYRIAVFTTVVTLVINNDSITASKVFSILAFYAALSSQLTRNFYLGFSDVAETWVGIKRLQKFLEYDEIHIGDHQKGMNFENSASYDNKATDYGEKIKENQSSKFKNGVAISINNGTACWNIMNETVKSENCAFALKNINIDFRKGKLFGIIGPVGSGKTSLLLAVLQELSLSSGSIIIDGVLSYASQEPWVFAGTVRQNILFGQQMDQSRYDRTVQACSLLTDFKQFPQGDLSIVGDKGAALSGGQKARINLARAIYRQADIYLLDDPLSAVDANVVRYLFNSAIGPESYLAEMKSTRILVTHQVHFLSKADWIIALNDGTIEFQGTVSDLSKSTLNVAELFNTNDTENNETSNRSPHQSSNGHIVDGTIEVMSPQNMEESSKGKIDGTLIGNFIKCGATPFRIFLFVGLFVCAVAVASSVDLWLTHMISREEIRKLQNTKNHTADINVDGIHLWSSIEYLYVYTALIVLFIIVLTVRNVIAASTMTNLTQGLHDSMFNSVMSSPLRFFDINPSGRILNRFSKDLGNADEILPKNIFDALQTSLVMPGIYVVIAITYPLLAIPVTILMIVFVCLSRITLKTLNDIKRMEGITRSPVFSHMATSLKGLSTIRALMAEKVLIHEFDSHQDIHSGAFFLYIYTSTALGFALEVISFLTITSIIIIFLLLDSSQLQGNRIGLVITQSLVIQEVINISAKQFAAVCNIMMAVERLLEYKNLPAEKEPEVPLQVSNSWPAQGKLEFRNVNYRYFTGADPVLKDLNLKINAGEKIGIVGRTGAGKSSLIGALFRIAEIDGTILIDDVDSKSILLKDLRTKISIIPQEAVLFSGTLRHNLDPFSEFDDAQLWKVLEEVELKDIVLSSGLESTVSTGGSNFSEGQKQLLCLARALLRNNTILVLDEATANVDPDTDILIQKTIREKFKHCTVLTIAHRLHTIMDSDRVLVMNFGRIAEFATPYQLLNKSDGIFKEMVEATGRIESERLGILAGQQYLPQVK